LEEYEYVEQAHIISALCGPGFWLLPTAPGQLLKTGSGFSLVHVANRGENRQMPLAGAADLTFPVVNSLSTYSNELAVM